VWNPSVFGAVLALLQAEQCEDWGKMEESLEGITCVLVRRGTCTRYDIYRKLHAAGVRLFCIDCPQTQTEAEGCNEYFCGWILQDMNGTLQTVVDKAMRALRSQNIKPDCILTYDEFGAPLAAALSEAYCLPGLPLGMVQCCQDKDSFREFCKSRGLPSVQHHLIGSLQDIHETDIVFPAVFKPRKGAGSHFVQRVNSREELQAALLHAMSVLEPTDRLDHRQKCVYEWYAKSQEHRYADNNSQDASHVGKQDIIITRSASISNDTCKLKENIIGKAKTHNEGLSTVLDTHSTSVSKDSSMSASSTRKHLSTHPFIVAELLEGSEVDIDVVIRDNEIMSSTHKHLSTHPFIVEELLEGSEVDIDVVVCDNKIMYMQVVDNLPCTSPYFMETGCRAPSLLSSEAQILLKKSAVDLIRAFAHDAAGKTCGDSACSAALEGSKDVLARKDDVLARKENVLARKENVLAREGGGESNDMGTVWKESAHSSSTFVDYFEHDMHCDMNSTWSSSSSTTTTTTLSSSSRETAPCMEYQSSFSSSSSSSSTASSSSSSCETAPCMEYHSSASSSSSSSASSLSSSASSSSSSACGCQDLHDNIDSNNTPSCNCPYISNDSIHSDTNSYTTHVRKSNRVPYTGMALASPKSDTIPESKTHARKLNGVLHIEMMMTKQGRAVPIEINCRLGGAECRLMNYVTWGVDLGMQALLVA
jgi:hypothetical protein